VRINRLLIQLSGDMLDIITVATEVNVFTREREVSSQCWLAGQVKFGPIVDSLAIDQNVRQPVRVPNPKNFGKLLERKSGAHSSGPARHHPGHLAQIRDLPLGPATHQGGAALLSRSNA
jgi:hypothetical protein